MHLPGPSHHSPWKPVGNTDCDASTPDKTTCHSCSLGDFFHFNLVHFKMFHTSWHHNAVYTCKSCFLSLHRNTDLSNRSMLRWLCSRYTTVIVGIDLISIILGVTLWCQPYLSGDLPVARGFHIPGHFHNTKANDSNTRKMAIWDCDWSIGLLLKPKNCPPCFCLNANKFSY